MAPLITISDNQINDLLYMQVLIFLDHKYVAKADTRQQSMGLSYIEAERQDLAKEVTNFIRKYVTRAIEARIAELVDAHGSYEHDTNFTNLPEWVETVIEELESILKTLAPEPPKV